MDKKDVIRYSVMIFFLVLFSIFSLRHFVLGGAEAASVDALCPFGGFESLYTLITTGSFVPRVMMSSLVLAVGLIITTLIFRRAFCGWICPFGTVQELLGKITKKKIKVPAKIDKYASYLKYAVLAWILIDTAVTGTLVFRGYDPFMTFFHFGKGIFWDYSPDEFSSVIVGFIITIFVLIAAVFIERVWCKYLCPLGAVMTVTSKIGIMKIHRDKKTCIDCKLCDNVCPSGINVSKQKTIDDKDCIGCAKCITSCPKKSLEFRFFKNAVPVLWFALGLILVFGSVIAAAKVAGVWQSVPQLEDFNEDDRITGDEIKGWMSLQEVADASAIPVDMIIAGVGLPTNIDPQIPMKEISSKYGIEFETEEVRDYIDNYQQGAEDAVVIADMTLIEVSQKTGICLGHLGREFSLPSDTNVSMTIREIAEQNGFAVQEMIEFCEGFTHDESGAESHDGSEFTSTDVACPWNIVEDPYPGKCGLYIDVDEDGLCDLSVPQ